MIKFKEEPVNILTDLHLVREPRRRMIIIIYTMINISLVPSRRNDESTDFTDNILEI